MKWNNIIIPLLLFTCIGLYLGMELKTEYKKEEKVYEYEAKKLHKKNDSLQRLNIFFDHKLGHFQMKIDSLQDQLNKHQKQIQTLKTKRDEKLNRIDNLNSNELYLFFSNFKTGY